MFETLLINETQFQVPIGFEGDIQIHRNDTTMSVPFEDMLKLIVMYVKWNRISQVEDAADEDILGIRW